MWPHNWESIFTHEIAQYANKQLAIDGKYTHTGTHTLTSRTLFQLQFAIINIAQLPYSCFIISFEWFLISYKFVLKGMHRIASLFFFFFFTCKLHVQLILDKNLLDWKKEINACNFRYKLYQLNCSFRG